MRKEYRKPMLYAESFHLVEHIGSGCYGSAPQTNNSNPYHDGNSCLYVDLDGEAYFTRGENVCADANQVPEGYIPEDFFYCYQGPAGGYAMPFHS